MTRDKLRVIIADWLEAQTGPEGWAQILDLGKYRKHGTYVHVDGNLILSDLEDRILAEL